MTADRFDGMRTFVAIVDTGSFSAAASRMGMSVPAVSRRLSGIEARIGARLLERTTRRVALTAPGQRFYSTAKQVLADVAAVETELRLKTTLGSLRVAVPDIFGRLFVAPVLPDLLERYPGLSISLALTRLGDRNSVQVADAVIELGHSKADTKGLRRTLGSYRHVICASNRYLKSAGTPQSPEELLGHSCIRTPGSSSAGPWVLCRGGQELPLSVGGRLVCNDSETALEAVVAGAGIARVPSFLVRERVRKGDVQVLLEDFEAPPSPVRIIGSEQESQSPALLALVDHLERHIDRDRLGL